MKSPTTSYNEFIKDAEGPSGIFCVFEDDGDTGYLYIYEPESRGVVRHLHIYDRSPELNVHEQDVKVEWSIDLNKCGVRIWGKLRGIIDLASDREGRVWLASRETPGIGDSEWLRGFRA